MTIRNILVPCFPGVEFDKQLAAALNVARQVEAHINTVFIHPDPAEAIAAIPAVALAAGVTAVTLQEDCRAAAAEGEALFTAWRTENALADCMVGQSLRTPYACWSERVGRLQPTVVRCSRLSDLVVLNLPTSAHPSAGLAFDAAVFESGRPALLVPQKLPTNLLGHVVIAWNGSLEATRAIAGAMTMLHEAEEVSIFTTFEQEELDQDFDLADFLTWHGIRARYFRPAGDEGSIGAALLRVASDHKATMLVMGAYTHSRIQQMLMGGVTRHVLAHTAIPVLMMH